MSGLGRVAYVYLPIVLYNGGMTNFPKGHIPWNKGKKQPYSDKTIQAMSEAKLRNPVKYWLGKKRPTKFWLGKKRENIRDENNYAWKGDKVTYSPLHSWIRRKLGKPVKCEHCGALKNLHWASISHKAKRDLKDFFALCSSCHKIYDI